MARETQVSRAEKGDSVITNVDVRQGIVANIILDGAEPRNTIRWDENVSGATDYALIAVGAIADMSFDLEFYFNGGKIGATVTQAILASSAGADIAGATVVAGISDDQLTYATKCKITLSAGNAVGGDWKVFLAKKAVLG